MGWESLQQELGLYGSLTLLIAVAGLFSSIVSFMIEVRWARELRCGDWGLYFVRWFLWAAAVHTPPSTESNPKPSEAFLAWLTCDVILKVSNPRKLRALRITQGLGLVLAFGGAIATGVIAE